MKAQYRITEEDYAAAVRFHTWRRFIASASRWRLLAGIFVVALLFIGVWLRPAMAPALPAVAVGVIVVAMIFALDLLIWIPIRARQQYRKYYKVIQEPIAVELGRELITRGERRSPAAGDR